MTPDDEDEYAGEDHGEYDEPHDVDWLLGIYGEPEENEDVEEPEDRPEGAEDGVPTIEWTDEQVRRYSRH